MIKVRTGFILAENDKILLLKHQRGDESYFVLPGGGLEDNESLEDSVLREAREETGLDLSIIKPLYLNQVCLKDRNIINITYLAEKKGGSLKKLEDIDNNIDPNIVGIEYIEVEKLKGLNFRPKKLLNVIINDIKSGFVNDLKYLGDLAGE